MLHRTYVFNMLTHPSFGDATATKYLDSIICGLLSRLCGMHFEKTNGAFTYINLIHVQRSMFRHTQQAWLLVPYSSATKVDPTAAHG